MSGIMYVYLVLLGPMAWSTQGGEQKALRSCVQTQPEAGKENNPIQQNPREESEGALDFSWCFPYD